ncbi:MAG TPA: SUF system NifU family Fe-S cluster assembly protein [Firmicutes bacterium]|nr:SUF system NifU family Fe-S cluster assembly protein [Bacillota bacterium]
MPISLSPIMMREIIMDHYSNPNNKVTPNDKQEYKSIRMDSTSCIDDITIYLKEKDHVIEDVKFDGVACTICTSSTDIMCDLVKGKNFTDANKIIDEYFNMIYEKPYNEEVLHEGVVFKNTYKQAARIKCATLGWNGLKELMKEDNKNDK